MTRQELYELVWTMPVIHAARSVGLSDKGLANKCKALNVPMPPRGHWARVSAGASIPRTPMPESSEADAQALKVLADIDIADGAVGASLKGRIAQKAPSGEAGGDGTRLDEGMWLSANRSAPRASPEAAWPSTSVVRSKQTPEQSLSATRNAAIDLAFIRTVASELQDMRAIESLVQAAIAHAIHGRQGDARCVLNWAAAVRAKLAERDPIAVLLRLAMSLDH
ncbi:hypothetical protein [Roseateles sp. P5_E4]